MDNFRLALTWAMETQLEAGLTMCVALIEAIPIHRIPEFLGTLEQLLTADTEDASRRGNQPRELSRSLARAKALNIMCHWQLFWGNREPAKKAHEESQSIYTGLAEAAGRVWAFTFLQFGMLYFISAPELAVAFLKKGLDSAENEKDQGMLSHCHLVLGNVYAFLGDFEQAKKIWKRVWYLPEHRIISRKWQRY